MPQPLSKVISKAHVQIAPTGIRPLSKAPELATLAMEAIESWSHVETFMLRTFVMLLGGRDSMAAEVYLALNSSTAKQQAIQAAAEVALAGNQRQKKIFDALMKLIKIHVKDRNKLAHGTFGLVEELPDALAWIDPIEAVKLDQQDLHPDKIYIYKKPELEKIVVTNYQICALGQNFTYILRNHVANDFGQLERNLVAHELLKPLIKNWEELIH